MKKAKKQTFSRVQVYEAQEGEPIERKLAKMTTEGDKITAQFPMIYTDRKDGVIAGYNIRTDRFEVARVAKEKIGKAEAAKLAKRDEALKEKEN